MRHPIIDEVVSIALRGARINCAGGPLAIHRNVFGDHELAIGQRVEFRPFRTGGGATIAANANPITAERAEVLRCFA